MDESTDELAVAEQVLLQLGDRIPDPTLQQGAHARFYSYLIGHRVKGLYQNFLHSLSSPATVGPVLAVRPLIEAAILSKWISLDPTLHGELWFAHAEDRELTAIREQERHLGPRLRTGDSIDKPLESVEQKAAWRDEAVARGKAAGKKYGDRPMPHIDRLVQEIEQREPGHRVAIRQAYDAAYRAFSPWAHTEASFFKANATETDAGLRFLGDVSPYKVEHMRIVAAAMFAYVLEIIGIAAGDGSEVLARLMRDYLTLFPHEEITHAA